MRILVDFDGTIVEDKYPEIGELKPGVKEAFTELRNKGVYISVLSCRTSVELFPNKIDRDNQMRLMENFLVENEIPFNEVINYSDKPIATYYIDDRAIEFKDNWNEIVKRIK